MKQLVPPAISTLPTTAQEGSPDVQATEAEQRRIVFVARYSVKNFFLAHWDLLQVAAILLHAFGEDFASATQLVFVPPDKANHGWWGPQRPLWDALGGGRALALSEWLELKRGHRRGKLLALDDVTFALSGFHSVYGRGVVGRAMEATCSHCVAMGAPSLRRVSPFYRAAMSVVLAELGQLRSRHTLDLEGIPALWIRRGKGHGRGYSAKVGRRCLNERELLAAITKANSYPGLTMTAVELAELPFKEQVPLFRRSGVFTGMHGAGYANIIFLQPGSVVAELCPMGYCTQSYEHMSERVDLRYLRWTNTHAENAKADYDTIVDIDEFVALMQRAVATFLKQPQ